MEELTKIESRRPNSSGEVKRTNIIMFTDVSDLLRAVTYYFTEWLALHVSLFGDAKARVFFSGN